MKRKIFVSINFFSVRGKSKGRLLKSIKNAHSNIIQDILPLGRGNEDLYVATCSTDDNKRLKLWDLDTMSVCVNYEDAHTDGIRCLSYLPRENLNDKSSFCSGSWDTTIRIWNLESTKPLGVLSGHTSTVNCLASSRVHLVSGSADRTCKVWDCNRNAILQTLNQSSSVSVVEISEDSSKIFTASDNIVVLWDSEYKSQKCIQIDRGITSMCFIEDKNLLVIGDKEGRVIGWDIRIKSSKNPFSFVKDVHRGMVKKIIPLPITTPQQQGESTTQEVVVKSVATCSYDKTVYITDVQRNKSLIGGLIGLIGLKTVASSEDKRSVFEEKDRIHSICLLQVIRMFEEQIIELENSKIQLRKIYEPFNSKNCVPPNILTFATPSTFHTSGKKKGGDGVGRMECIQWMGRDHFFVQVEKMSVLSEPCSISSTGSTNSSEGSADNNNNNNNNNCGGNDVGSSNDIKTIPGLLYLFPLDTTRTILDNDELEKIVSRFSLLFHRDILTVLGFVRLREDLLGILYHYDTSLLLSKKKPSPQDFTTLEDILKTTSSSNNKKEEEEDQKKKKKSSKKEFFEKWFLMKRIANVLRYLHTKEILHLNFSPKSILFTKEEVGKKDKKKKDKNKNKNKKKEKKSQNTKYTMNSQLKIIGYGVTEEMSKMDPLFLRQQQGQKIRYCSPEILKAGFVDQEENKKKEEEEESLFSKKMDVYSLGMVIYSIATGRVPYHNIFSDLEVSMKIINGEPPDFSDLKNEYLKKIVVMCTDPEPEKRPSLNELISSMENFEKQIFSTEGEGEVLNTKKRKKKEEDEEEGEEEVEEEGEGEDEDDEFGLYNFVSGSLKCPITRMVMKEPYRLLESGITYEKNAVDKYLKNFNTDPVSDTVLKSKEMEEDISARRVIDDLLKNVE